MIHEQIKEELKSAMKAGEPIKKEVLRGVLSAFTNELVADGEKPDEMLSDEKAQEVLGRLAKQRREAIQQYENGGRPELAESEQRELTILEAYLPEQMSEDEVREHIEAKKQALEITDASQKGQLMGAVMKDLKDRADGTKVKELVEASLSSS